MQVFDGHNDALLRLARGAPHVTFLGEDGKIDGVDIGGTLYATESDGRI